MAFLFLALAVYIKPILLVKCMTKIVLNRFILVQANNRLSDIGRLKANVKRPSVRNKRSSRNPVKALAARTDVKVSDSLCWVYHATKSVKSRSN